jgi:hypothetical protein
MNIFMTSHGVIVPSLIDAKCKSTLKSLAKKIELYHDADNLMSHVSIRRDLNKEKVVRGVTKINEFPVPTHIPKFLGLVYSRLGLRGRQLPYNQYQSMAESNNAFNTDLLPILRNHGMLLPDAVYTEAGARIPMVREGFSWME